MSITKHLNASQIDKYTDVSHVMDNSMKLQNDRQKSCEEGRWADGVVQTFVLQHEEGRLKIEEFLFVIFDEQSKTDQSSS